MAADAVLVWLHGQDEGRDANGDGVDQAQLRGRIGIGEREDERGDREEPKQIQEDPAEELPPLVVPSKPKEAPVEKPKAEPVEELPPLVQPEEDKIKREDVRQEAAQIAASISDCCEG